jgi:patatin-like phospholipase/acyl hydrolase
LGGVSFAVSKTSGLAVDIIRARATSAAPPYFKPFIKNETKCSYLDGALYHNNPVWVAHHERKLNWSDVSAQQPDVFLSIGTGYHNPNTKNMEQVPRSSWRSTEPKIAPQPSVLSPPTPKLLSFTGQIWNTATNRLDNILNCTKIWDSFRLDVLETHSTYRQRYIRLNPDLQFKVPSLDQVNQLYDIQAAAATEMQNSSSRVREVAHRLIASTFFFDKLASSTKEVEEGKFECKGECPERHNAV